MRVLAGALKFRDRGEFFFGEKSQGFIWGVLKQAKGGAVCAMGGGKCVKHQQVALIEQVGCEVLAVGFFAGIQSRIGAKRNGFWVAPIMRNAVVGINEIVGADVLREKLAQLCHDVFFIGPGFVCGGEGGAVIIENGFGVVVVR